MARAATGQSQPLRRDVEINSSAAILWDRKPALGSKESLVLHADFVGSFDGDLTTDRLVAVADDEVAEHVAVGVDRRADDGRLGIDDRIENVVLHDDCCRCAPRRLGMICGDRGNWLAVESDYIVSEYWLVLVFEAVGFGTRHIVLGHDRVDALDPPCRARVDRDDSRRRVW
jgi:hypothetical protein